MFPALIRGISVVKARSMANELLRKLGMGNRSTHHPSALSGGEQQRVAIARALINSPKILFCDEPTGNLDSKTGEKICQLLKELNEKDGFTIIIATHSNEIAKISSKVFYIKDGIISNNKGND